MFLPGSDDMHFIRNCLVIMILVYYKQEFRTNIISTFNLCIASVCSLFIYLFIYSYHSLSQYAEENHDIPEDIVWNYLIDLLLVSNTHY